MIRLNVFIRTTESNRDELLRTAEELVAAHEATPHFTTLVPRMQCLSEMKLEKFVF